MTAKTTISLTITCTSYNNQLNTHSRCDSKKKEDTQRKVIVSLVMSPTILQFAATNNGFMIWQNCYSKNYCSSQKHRTKWNSSMDVGSHSHASAITHCLFLHICQSFYVYQRGMKKKKWKTYNVKLELTSTEHDRNFNNKKTNKIHNKHAPLPNSAVFIFFFINNRTLLVGENFQSIFYFLFFSLLLPLLEHCFTVCASGMWLSQISQHFKYSVLCSA